MHISHSGHKTKLEYKQVVTLTFFFGIYIKKSKPVQILKLMA